VWCCFRKPLTTVITTGRRRVSLNAAAPGRSQFYRVACTNDFSVLFVLRIKKKMGGRGKVDETRSIKKTFLFSMYATPCFYQYYIVARRKSQYRPGMGQNRPKTTIRPRSFQRVTRSVTSIRRELGRRSQRRLSASLSFRRPFSLENASLFARYSTRASPSESRLVARQSYTYVHVRRVTRLVVPRLRTRLRSQYCVYTYTDLIN